MNSVSLILCIHNHQPVGNLPEVFEHAYTHAYEPFLSAVEEFPDVKLVMHNTGPLLEWYEENAPDYIARLRALVERGQVEVLTGGFYEPILVAIPERDVVGQIRRMNRYVEERFGTRPRGMWLAERVWEPHLARLLKRAGVEYLPLDDYEFMLSGVPDEDLTGYFMTEDQGEPVRVFPISKALRYAIPFQEPEAAVGRLRELAERRAGACAVFGDDGEKFGVWPGTYDHVYEGGWLRRFLTALRDNSDWLKTRTFAEFVDTHEAVGRVYLPASSYPEMMEWALPTPARRSYERMLAELKAQGRFDDWGPYLSGGIWRGFISKYEESNLMIRKMIRVSRKIELAKRLIEELREADELNHIAREAGSGGDPALDPDAAALAEKELWRGQCNCAYWHGVFGGLYLPHLRSAVYEHLIRAENHVDSLRGTHWNVVEVLDHDLDGRQEVVLESQWANVYVAPARGGVLIEVDLRRPCWNLVGTMSRYIEAYHKRHDPAEDTQAPSGGVASIHDDMAPREKGLERFEVADRVPRRAAIDRFLPPGTSRDQLEAAVVGDDSDFAAGKYEFEPSRQDGGVGVAMSRVGSVRGVDVCMRKKVCIEPGGLLSVEYAVESRAELAAAFSSEWNLAFLTGSEEYSRFEFSDGRTAAAGGRQTLENVTELTLLDRLRGSRVSFRFEPACTLWSYPLETASQSEGGLERVFQGTTLVAVWETEFAPEIERRFSVEMREESAEGVLA